MKAILKFLSECFLCFAPTLKEEHLLQESSCEDDPPKRESSQARAPIGLG